MVKLNTKRAAKLTVEFYDNDPDKALQIVGDAVESNRVRPVKSENLPRILVYTKSEPVKNERRQISWIIECEMKLILHQFLT